MPESNFKVVIEALVGSNVRFVLIGGVAMVAHGAADFTVDIDICYDRERANLEALAAALQPLHPTLRGAPPGLPFRWEPRTIRAGANFTLDTDAGSVDKLADVAGVNSLENLWDRADEMVMFGHLVRVASIDDLLAMKRAAGRDKDLRQILSLEALRNLEQQQGN